jgi:cytochrome P450
MATVAVRSLDQDLSDPQFVQDPYPVYVRLQAEDPVHWCEPWQQWIVTRFKDVRAITLDPSRFSSAGWEQSYLQQLGPDLRTRLPHLEHHYATDVLSNTDAQPTPTSPRGQLHAARPRRDQARRREAR